MSESASWRIRLNMQMLWALNCCRGAAACTCKLRRFMNCELVWSFLAMKLYWGWSQPARWVCKEGSDVIAVEPLLLLRAKIQVWLCVDARLILSENLRRKSFNVVAIIISNETETNCAKLRTHFINIRALKVCWVPKYGSLIYCENQMRNFDAIIL